MEKKTIKIYVIGRISQDAHAWTDEVCAPLEAVGIEVFKPKDHNPWKRTRHEKYSRKVFTTDLLAMKRSHIGLMLPRYGCDCAWEAGWYANSDKPVIVFVSAQTQWLRDWMVKGGIGYVFTDNRLTYRRLKADPILKYATIKFVKLPRLSHMMKWVYRRHYEEVR
jgi:nucleoside 2-deoxyribosyltransferase